MKTQTQRMNKGYRRYGSDKRNGSYGPMTPAQAEKLDRIAGQHTGKGCDDLFRIVRSDPAFGGLSDQNLSDYLEDAIRICR